MVAAVRNHTVGAAVGSLADGLRRLFSPLATALPRVPLVVWATSRMYLVQHHDVVQRFTNATKHAETYLAGHPDRSARSRSPPPAPRSEHH